MESFGGHCFRQVLLMSQTNSKAILARAATVSLSLKVVWTIKSLPKRSLVVYWSVFWCSHVVLSLFLLWWWRVCINKSNGFTRRYWRCFMCGRPKVTVIRKIMSLRGRLQLRLVRKIEVVRLFLRGNIPPTEVERNLPGYWSSVVHPAAVFDHICCRMGGVNYTVIDCA